MPISIKPATTQPRYHQLLPSMSLAISHHTGQVITEGANIINVCVPGPCYFLLAKLGFEA